MLINLLTRSTGLVQILKEAGDLGQMPAYSGSPVYRNRCFHGIKIGTRPQVFNSSLSININQMVKIHVNVHLLNPYMYIHTFLDLLE